MGSSTPSGSVAELNVGRRRVESFLRRKRRAVTLLLVAVLAGGGAWAIGVVVPAEAKAAITLDQCANLGTVCDTAHPGQWQHGNLNENNSQYAEGESVAYRAMMTDLTVGATYAVTIEWDTTQTGKHAIDYLTSFDRTIATADPCAPASCGGAATLPIPVDPNVTAAGVTEAANRFFTAFGGTFPGSGASVTNSGDLCADATCTIASNPSAHSMTGTYDGNSQTSITVYVTAASDTVHLAWGGHIAERRDWGSGKSAVALPGSPYHMRIISLGCSDVTNCGAGSQDRSLSSAAVVYGASITIVKEASVEGATPYQFTATPTPLTNFSLTDDGSSLNTKTFSNILNFGTYSIDEQSAENSRLDSVDCSVIDGNGGTQTPTLTGVDIDLREGESVTCTFRNEVTGPKSIDLTKSADPTTYGAVGDVITYTYVITNTGSVTLGPTQFTVTDDHIGTGTPFACGPVNASLVPLASLSCTAKYPVVAADINDKSVTNKATASGAGVSSPLRTATVTAVIVPPSSTTTSSTTTSTTTTTVAPTTSVGSTTTFVANVVTTTVAPTTTSLPKSTTTTTAPATTTTAAPITTTTIAPATTSGSDFQALLQPTTTVPADSDFLVLLPDELPKTGLRFNFGFLVAAIALLSVGALIGFFNVRSNGSTRKERNT